MRRILSLVLLLCFAVTQAAAAACPMAGGPGAAEDGTRAHHGESAGGPAAFHAGHAGADHRAASHERHAAHDAPARHDHGSHDDGAADDGCGIVMPCGVLAAPSSDAPGLPLGAATDGASSVLLSRPLSPDPAAEPPPPRLADVDPA